MGRAYGRPAISLIVAIDSADAGAASSLRDVLKAVAGYPVEVLAATSEPWRDAPEGVTVVHYNAASRGDRFDRAADVARGSLLAFIDQRVRLPADWPQLVRQVFDDPAVQIAGGPVIARTHWLAERVSACIQSSRFGGTRSGGPSRLGPPRQVAELVGSNLVIRAELFHAVGGYQSPTVGGEAVRLCYKVRTLMGHAILSTPLLAVTQTPQLFPAAFLRETAGYGRARGDLARRFREASPFFPFGLPTLVALAVAIEIALLPFHRTKATLAGIAALALLYMLMATGILFARNRARLGDRLIAVAGLPFVALVFGVSFAAGFLGPNLGEVKPLSGRRRSLRVLIINWRDVTHPWAGGAETYMHEIGRRWAQAGLDVGWLCQRHRNSDRQETIDGIRIYRVGGRLTLYPLVMLSYVLRLRRRYDVIVDCENGIPFFTPLFARRTPKVLVVHHVHREIFMRETRPPMRWLGLFLEGRLMPRLYRHVPVVAVSRSTANDLRSLGFSPEQISVVHNGVHEAAAVDRKPSSRPTLVYTGRLTPQKRVDVVIRALPWVLEAFPLTRLHVVGQGPARPQLERLVWSLGLANNVRFHGYLPNHVRDEISAEAWLAVCASSFEGWGVSCMEASARGLPVVASDVQGLRDSVRDGETGVLVPPGDAEAMAAAVVDLFGDPERREQMSAAGKAWAAKHSWDHSASELRLLIAGLVGGASRRVPLEVPVGARPARIEVAQDIHS